MVYFKEYTVKNGMVLPKFKKNIYDGGRNSP